MKPNRPELLSVPEVCNILKLPKRSVYRLLKTKRLRMLRIGRLIRITADDLAEFIRDELQKGMA